GGAGYPCRGEYTNRPPGGVAVGESRTKRAQSAVRAIKDFYALGTKIPPKASSGEAYREGAIGKAAEGLGVTPELARKARQFADPVTGYTRAELRELCRLIKEVQPDQDDRCAVFGRSHLLRM